MYGDNKGPAENPWAIPDYADLWEDNLGKLKNSIEKYILTRFQNKKSFSNKINLHFIRSNHFINNNS